MRNEQRPGDSDVPVPIEELMRQLSPVPNEVIETQQQHPTAKAPVERVKRTDRAW